MFLLHQRPVRAWLALALGLLLLAGVAWLIRDPGAAQAAIPAPAKSTAASAKVADPQQLLIGPGQPGQLVPGARPARTKLQLAPAPGPLARHPIPALAPLDPITFAVDDGSYETAFGYGSNTVEYAMLWLNRFTAPVCAYPITLNSISIVWPSAGNTALLGQTARLLVYLDADGDGDPSNAVLVSQQFVTISSLDAFQTYPVSITMPGPTGDLYIGFEDYWAEAGYTPKQYPAAQDTDQSQGRSWIIGMTGGGPPNITLLTANDLRAVVDLLGYPGNWLIRASGTSAQGGCPPTFTATATAVAPTRTLTNTPTSTAVAPTRTATNTPTNTAVVPTRTATNTPTATAVAPTRTPTNTPTATAVAPTRTPTNTPTNTAVAPTRTATNTPTNTAVAPTRTATNTPTNTAVAPTRTATPRPTVTRTAVPPTVTATRTSLPPSPTSTTCATETPPSIITPAFTPGPGCSSTPPAGVLSAIITDHPATTAALFTNHSATCSYPIGLAVYRKVDNTIDHQVLYDYRLAVIPPQSSLTLTVNNPSCAYQGDAFWGNLLVSFAGGARYGTRRLDDTDGDGTNYCSTQCLPPPPPTLPPPPPTLPPPPPTVPPTTVPCSLCNTYISDINIACNGDGSYHWSVTVRNNADCTVNSTWRDQLQIQRNYGGWHTVLTQTGSGSFPPGDTSIGGNYCYQVPPNTTGVRHVFTLTGNPPSCRPDPISPSIAPCPVQPTCPLDPADPSAGY